MPPKKLFVRNYNKTLGARSTRARRIGRAVGRPLSSRSAGSPDSLYFYASQPIAVEKNIYLVKAEFLPMDSIQGQFDSESSTLDHCALANSRRPIIEMRRIS